MRIVALALFAGTFVPAWSADTDQAALLERVRWKVLRNAKNAPRYVCRQEIERQEFELAHTKPPLPYGNPARMCELVSAEEPGKSSRLQLTESDRAKLDVMLASGSELFSWPGERGFDVKTPGDLIGGGFSGNGDFAGFLLDVFSPKQAKFYYAGSCGAPGCVRFTYVIPPEVSRYTVSTKSEHATVGFHGTLDVDPRSADLIQLTVTAGDLQTWLGSVCETRTRMRYTGQHDGTGFLVPESTDSEFLSADGSYSVNRVSYIGCRRYSTESVLSFAAAAASTSPVAKMPALPMAGAVLRLRFTSTIDSETNFAGDTVQAALDRPVLDAEHVTIPAGTVVRGHVAQLERVYGPHPAVVIALRLDTIVLRDVPVKITLEARGHTDDRGRAMFRFAGEKVMLDKTFVTDWRIR
ncbi:MAG TPA: hypothetical protein VEV37_07250 [Bryobacteraceae bacterium]|nr:hypothetical protein [Bryobacteraceae bacterium]